MTGGGSKEHGGGEPRAGAAVRVSDVQVRERLEALIRETGSTPAALSRLLGRNAAYVQQYLRRGVPRQLPESDRRLLARHFGVSEAFLGGPGDVPDRPGNGAAAILVPVLDSRDADAPPIARQAIDRRLAERLTRGSPDALAILEPDSDSLSPLVRAGDQLLLDLADRRALRDGLYLFRRGLALVLREVRADPVDGVLRLADGRGETGAVADAEVTVVGRVLWLGRRVG